MKTKIIHVISDTNIGGAGKYILTFLKGFNREKFDAIVILPENSQLKPEIEKLDIQAIEAEYIDDKSYSQLALSILIKAIGENLGEGKTIIHTHGCLSARIAAGMLKKQRKNIRIVFTRHSVFEPTKKAKSFFKKFFNKIFNKMTTDKIIAVANAAKRNLIETGVPENLIEVIYNGVEPLKEISEVEKKAAYKKFGLSEFLPVITMAARLTEVKGQAYVIEAAKRYEKKAQFAIAGTGEDEEKLRELAKNCPNVHILGFVDDIQALLNISYAQINASFGTEAASLSILEGMSLGIPTIATNYGGNPELIKNNQNGLIIRQKSSTAIEDALETILHRQDLYDKMRRGSLQIYNKNFTNKIMIERMEAIYEEI